MPENALYPIPALCSQPHLRVHSKPPQGDKGVNEMKTDILEEGPREQKKVRLHCFCIMSMFHLACFAKGIDERGIDHSSAFGEIGYLKGHLYTTNDLTAWLIIHSELAPAFFRACTEMCEECASTIETASKGAVWVRAKKLLRDPICKKSGYGELLITHLDTDWCE